MFDGFPLVEAQSRALSPQRSVCWVGHYVMAVTRVGLPVAHLVMAKPRPEKKPKQKDNEQLPLPTSRPSETSPSHVLPMQLQPGGGLCLQLAPQDMHHAAGLDGPVEPDPGLARRQLA